MDHWNRAEHPDHWNIRCLSWVDPQVYGFNAWPSCLGPGWRHLGSFGWQLHRHPTLEVQGRWRQVDASKLCPKQRQWQCYRCSFHSHKHFCRGRREGPVPQNCDNPGQWTSNSSSSQATDPWPKEPAELRAFHRSEWCHVQVRWLESLWILRGAVIALNGYFYGFMMICIYIYRSYMSLNHCS